MALEYPLAELELTRSGKRKATYAVRSVAVGLAFAAITAGWLSSFPAAMGTTETMSLVARTVAITARLFQFFAVFVVAPLVTAGLVTQEKQDRTLGLLLMADMGGRDIFLSKYLAAFLYVELLSLSALPILAIASLLGGISVPAMALQLFLLTIAATATCAVGLAFSTIARRPVEALFYTILAQSFWLVVTLGVDMAKPVSGFLYLNIAMAAWTTDSPVHGMFYWVPSAVLTLVIGALAVSIAIRLLPQQAHERTAPKPKRRSPSRAAAGAASTTATANHRPKGDARNLVSAGAPGMLVSEWPLPLRLLVALGLIPLGLLPCVGGALVVILMVFDTTSSLWSSRCDGSMDSLFVTSMDDDTLTRMLNRTYLRRAMLLLPAVLGPGIVYGVLTVMAHVCGAMELGDGNAFLSSVPIWLVGIVSGAGQLLVPVTRFFLYLALACWASTLTYRPVGQTLAAFGVFLVVNVGIYFGSALVGGTVSTMASVLSSTPDTTMVWHGVSQVVMAFVAALANVGCIFFFRNQFAHQVSRTWRTGISQPVMGNT